MYKGIFTDVEKVKQILASHGHKPVNQTLIFELLEDLQQTDRVVEVLLGSSSEKSNAETRSDSSFDTGSSCVVSKLHSGFETDTDGVLMKSSYSDEIPREGDSCNNSINTHPNPYASISVDLTTDDDDETFQLKVLEFSKFKAANKFVAKTDPNHSLIEMKDNLPQNIDLTKQPDTMVKEESCLNTDTDKDLGGENKHNDADVASLGSDSDAEIDDYYEEMLLESEDSNGRHSPLPLLSPTALRATSSPHFLNQLDDMLGSEPSTHRVDEMLEENNNDPNNNLEDIQIMEQNNGLSLTSDDVSKEHPHGASCTFHSNLPQAINQIHDSPKPGCSKDSYFDDVPASSHSETDANISIETVDMRRAKSATTMKQLEVEVTGNSEEEMLVNSLDMDAMNIKKVFPNIPLMTIRRTLQANKNAINRVVLCLWDLLPDERPLAILSGKRTSKDGDCPLGLKKKYLPVEARDEAGQYKEIGSTDDSNVDYVDTDNSFVDTSMNNEMEQYGNMNMMPIDNPTRNDVSSDSCLSYFSTEVTPLRTSRVDKGINYSNEATDISDQITGSEDAYDYDDENDRKYNRVKSSVKRCRNKGHHDKAIDSASGSNGFSIRQCVGSKVKLKPSKLNNVVGCRPYGIVNRISRKSSRDLVHGSFKLNNWRSSAQEDLEETNNAELKENHVPFNPVISWPADELETKCNFVDSNIVTDVDKQTQSSQLKSVTRLRKSKINMKPSSFHVPKDSGETYPTTNRSKKKLASTSSEDIRKLAMQKKYADISGADIERRYRDTEVAVNVPKKDDMTTYVQGSGIKNPEDQELIQPGKLKVEASTQSLRPIINHAFAVVKNGRTTWKYSHGAIRKRSPKSTALKRMLEEGADHQFRFVIDSVPEHVDTVDTVHNSFQETNKQTIAEGSNLLDEAVGSTTSNLSVNSNKIPNVANDSMLFPKQNAQNIHSMPKLNDQTIGTMMDKPSASSIESARISNLPKQLQNSCKTDCNSTVADIPVTLNQSLESQVSSSSSKLQTTTSAAQESSSLKLDPPRELFNPLINMFPDVNPNYIAKVCIKGKKANQVLETLVERLLESGVRHPRIVNPEPEPTMFTADEQYENLQAIFPDAHPEYLRDFAESHWNDPEAMKNFVEQRLENHDYPTMATYLEKVKITEQIRRYTVDFDVKNFLEIFPDPFTHFENPARVYKFNVFAFDFLKRHFNGIKVSTIQKVYSYSYNGYHISLAAKELESIRRDMKSRRADKPILIEDIPLLQEFAFIRNKNEIRQYMEHQKMTEEREFEELKKANQLLQCQCCFDDECMPRKCFTCTEGHIFCKSCILLGTQTKIGEGHLEFPCFTTCSGEFTLEVLQKVVTPTTFSILLRKKQEAEVKAAGLEGLVSCPFCHFASIPPPEDRIFKCLNPDCMKETCRLCKELNHVPLRCDEVTKGEEARHYLEEKMTAALVRKCYRCSRTFFKEEGCNKMTCPCGASMCYICGQPVKDYRHFNGQGSNRIDLCPLWSDNALMNAKAVRASAEAAEKEILMQNPNLKIDATALMPKLPAPTKGPHQDIPNAHLLPVHAQNRGQANVLR